MSSVKPSYFELERRLEQAQAEIQFLERLNRDLSAMVDKLARLQPPPPIIMQVTPEQLERVKQMVGDKKGLT